ncbi:tyrosine recombinase XerC [Rivibacter subsaxonicus]|uniref:Tyrosine recombinase XerC n=1 Tax=Rivibacter subsaxonicus TaxID=457575 RepID=A0A4V2FSQ3_9BURK|nr:tyrosine recombinase XerC [Rivibacter subsaxonicus]RZT95035.1 integrase/recombinase XerC [Rivibacter subsaxonicus]
MSAVAVGEASNPTAALPLPQAIERHLTHLRVERRLAETSLKAYRDAFVRLAAAMERDAIALDAVQPHHARRWMAQLHAGGLGPHSLAQLLSAWRGLYRWLGQQGVVSLNPVDGLRAPRAPRPLPKALSVDQAMALADHHADPAPTRGDPELAVRLELRDRCIVELLYGCGLRVSELSGLDLIAGTAARGWIDAQAGEAQVLGKGSKRRGVPVGTAALAALAAWLPARAALAAADEPALFVTRGGTRLTPSQIRSRLKDRAIAAGLPTHVHPHMLRHSFASHLLQSSSDLRAVQELLGHANITTTQIYTKLDFQHLAKTYDAAHPRAKRRG